MIMLLQSGDLVNAVKEIGLRAVVVLLVVGALIAAFKYWSNTLFKYFSERLDKKDETIKIIHDEYNKNLRELIELRHNDNIKTELVIQMSLSIQQEILSTLKIMNTKLEAKDK